jgi:hypothetical protein
MYKEGRVETDTNGNVTYTDVGTFIRDVHDSKANTQPRGEYLEVRLRDKLAFEGNLNDCLVLTKASNDTQKSFHYPILHEGNYKNWALPVTEKGQAIYCDDLLKSYSCPTLVRWDSKTLNTPYQAKLTQGQAGFAIVFGEGGGKGCYHTITAWSLGGENNHCWIKRVDNGRSTNWAQIFTSEGGTLTNNIKVYADKSAYPQIRVGNEYNKSGAILYTDHNHVDIQNYKNNKATTLSLTHEEDVQLSGLLKLWLSDGQNYNIFGAHNKPMTFYKGNGKADTYTIDTGGIGNVVMIYNTVNNYFGFVSPLGGIFWIMYPTYGYNGQYAYSYQYLFSSNYAIFQQGKLTLNTGSDILNKDEVEYYYQVL